MSQKKKLEGAIRQTQAKLSRFDVFVTEYNVDQLEILQTKLQSHETLLKEFEDILLEYVCLDASADHKAKIENYSAEFEDNYFRIISKARSLLPSIRQTSTPVSQLLNQSIIEPRIKLPTLNLPSFTGVYEEWTEFRDTFVALVHSNVNISNVQKFHYLKASLKQDAAKVIYSLEANDANYLIAWDLLKERYENIRLIVNGHIRAIFEIPSLAKESHTALRNLSDTFVRNIRCLTALKLPTNHWDALLIYIITSKLDATTKRDWEALHTKNVLPQLEQLTKFLNEKCNLLEALQTKGAYGGTKQINEISYSRRDKTNSFAMTTNYKCPNCAGYHSIFKCKNFTSLSVDARNETVRKKNLCYNCLKAGHSFKKCRSSACLKCNRHHHTLLHKDSVRQTVDARSAGEGVTRRTDKRVNTNETISCISHSVNSTSQVLLSTACIYVADKFGNYHKCRVLLDSASQSHFLSEKMCNLLQLKGTDAHSVVNGINSNETPIRHTVNVTIKSMHSTYKREVVCLVLNKITENLPACSFNADAVNVPDYIQLADINFNTSATIDMLLGATVFFDILKSTQIRLGVHSPILQATEFGFILAGNVYIPNHVARATHAHCALSDQLAKFWAQEEVDEPRLSAGEQECEKIYDESTERSKDGRFIVSIPFRDNLSLLGDSRDCALKRFMSLERRLKRDAKLSEQYKQFMQEYIDLGQMSVINDERSLQNYYLAHHGVMKETSSTTKLRAVFDGSARTTSGLSLNDVQWTGPVVQSDLFTILLRFRKHRYVFTADVEKMYRQILVNKEQLKYQRILWRSEENEPLRCFALNTVTYGLTSSPYLATRCLKQLSVESALSHPIASEVIREDFYVDDLLSGSETIEGARDLKRDVTNILKSACFNLRKWIANDKRLLNEDDNEGDLLKIISIDDSNIHKTLGLFWNPSKDILQYNVTESNDRESVTKRTVLSVISRTHDPLGYCAPIVITAKMFMQTLWKSKLQWDEPLSFDLLTEWQNYLRDSKDIDEIQVSRRVLVSNAIHIELHGFCDASIKAYAACVYVKSTNEQGDCEVNLLCAKSRVAPVRCISLPRLELSGALLLSKLMKRVNTALKLKIDEQYYWCDATIVLCWINSDSSRWKTYVANRVSEIQTLTNAEKWHHVKTQDNAADILSRGSTSKFLQTHQLWWHGPNWLRENAEHWPIDIVHNHDERDESAEFRKANVTLVAVVEKFKLFERFSNLNKLKRVMAYCLRFITNTKKHSNKITGPFTVEELKSSLKILIKVAQREVFTNELKLLQRGEPVSNLSSLLPLSPFLDDAGLIRVGGRLKNSNLEYDAKHQIILPAKHKLSELIATTEHVRQFHCGAQLLLASLREKFWLISGRRLTRHIVNRCVTCFRAKPTQIELPMGQLPAERLTASFAFENCGVDYGGPYMIKDKKTRGCKQIKCYICIFVCFSTKAVHLELASDLSTNCFLSVLRRFVSRRGKPLCMFSDNATNFIGTKNELRHLVGVLQQRVNAGDLKEFFLNEEITWKTIPPRAPNFGGLWESAVKSVKHHLKRMTSSASLIYEEFYTILTQVEAILNSRPLSPMSSDPHDLNPLTPGHFLIGRPMTAVIDEDLVDSNQNRLLRHQRIQQVVQQFWKRWSREYLGELQTKLKWNRQSTCQLEVGALVIVREDNLPPCKWLLGRVLSFNSGADGVNRVAIITTNTGEIKRSVRRLCLLPIYD